MTYEAQGKLMKALYKDMDVHISKVVHAMRKGSALFLQQLG